MTNGNSDTDLQYNRDIQPPAGPPFKFMSSEGHSIKLNLRLRLSLGQWAWHRLLKTIGLD
jgi:hypothetical protein